MPFKIHTVGLVCFIRRQNEFLVALPNGVNVDNPCPPYKKIDVHRPYLIVRREDIVSSELQGTVISKCLIYDLSAIVRLNFQHANSAGDFDPSHHQDKMYRWKVLDPGFTINTANPSKVITSFVVRRGIILARRLPNTDALISEVIVPVPGGTIEVMADSKKLVLENNSEIVIANVSPNWIVNVNYPDDDDHFFIYYILGSGGAKCAQPLPDHSVPESTSPHPFLTGNRGLRVSCANTWYR